MEERHIFNVEITNWVLYPVNLYKDTSLLSDVTNRIIK